MDDLNLHGIEYFAPFIQKQELPPLDFLGHAKQFVKTISYRYNLPYEHALEDIVRSLSKGANKTFKKDVRCWKLKFSQSRKDPLDLSLYERKLADAIDRYHEKLSNGLTATDIDTIANNRLPILKEQVCENVSCPTHKKDCRTWLHKTSDSSRKRKQNTCEWHYKKHSTKQGTEDPSVIHTDGAGDFGSVIQQPRSTNKTTRAQRKVRFRAPGTDSSSEEIGNSSDDENQDPNERRKSKRSRHHLRRTDNFTQCENSESEDSDHEADDPPVTKQKQINTRTFEGNMLINNGSECMNTVNVHDQPPRIMLTPPKEDEEYEAPQIKLNLEYHSFKSENSWSDKANTNSHIKKNASLETLISIPESEESA